MDFEDFEKQDFTKIFPPKEEKDLLIGHISLAMIFQLCKRLEAKLNEVIEQVNWIAKYYESEDYAGVIEKL